MDITNLNKDRKNRRKESIDLSTMVYGKIPPQAKDLEKAILGAVVEVKEAIEIIAAILTPECFYLETHRYIFMAMMAMHKRGAYIDILTLIEELRKMEYLDMVGGPYYLTTLSNGVVSAVNTEEHCLIVKQMFMKREVIRIAGEMISDAYEDKSDVFELLDYSENAISKVSMDNFRNSYKHLDGPLSEVVARIETIRHKEKALTGIPTGFKKLNETTHGLQDTDLILIAARPAQGKTAFALNLALNAIHNPEKPSSVGFFSLEMSMQQLIERLIATKSGVSLVRIKRGYLDDEQMKELYLNGINPLIGSKLYLDDTAGLRLSELRAKARKMVHRDGVKMIIVDYLQLMRGEVNERDNREREIAKVSGGLKMLAKELGVPIIALSQLSRDVEKRSNQTPQLSDLRDSGSLEQDADIVMFLHRPSKEECMKDAELNNTGRLIIAKHRNGELDEITLNFFGHLQKWCDLVPNELSETGGKWKAVDFSKKLKKPEQKDIDFNSPEEDDDQPF